METIKPHMRHVYVVTRAVTGAPLGQVHIPTLGVHTNFARASKHMQSICEDRVRIGSEISEKQVPDYYAEDHNRYRLMREIYVIGKGDLIERLRIEQWPTRIEN